MSLQLQLARACNVVASNIAPIIVWHVPSINKSTSSRGVRNNLKLPTENELIRQINTSSQHRGVKNGLCMQCNGMKTYIASIIA